MANSSFHHFDPIGIDTALQEKARAAGGQPLTSWWLNTDRATFSQRAKEELPRMSGSTMKLTIRPIVIGGAI